MTRFTILNFYYVRFDKAQNMKPQNVHLAVFGRFDEIVYEFDTASSHLFTIYATNFYDLFNAVNPQLEFSILLIMI